MINASKFKRDEASNSLINTDTDAYLRYKQSRNIEKQFKVMEKKISELERHIQQLNERLLKLE